MKKMVLKWFKTRKKKNICIGQRNFFRISRCQDWFVILNPFTFATGYTSEVIDYEWFLDDDLKYPGICRNNVILTVKYAFADVEFENEYKHRSWLTN